MDNIKITVVVDTDSLQKILNRISQKGIGLDSINAGNIVWKIGKSYKSNDTNNTICVPVIVPPKIINFDFGIILHLYCITTFDKFQGFRYRFR